MQCLRDPVGVTRSFETPGDAPIAIDRGNLANAHALQSCILDLVQEHVGRWLDRKVFPAPRSLEVAALADERSSDHTSHLMRPPQHAPRCSAEIVELSDRDHFLMR